VEPYAQWSELCEARRLWRVNWSTLIIRCRTVAPSSLWTPTPADILLATLQGKIKRRKAQRIRQKEECLQNRKVDSSEDLWYLCTQCESNWNRSVSCRTHRSAAVIIWRGDGSDPLRNGEYFLLAGRIRSHGRFLIWFCSFEARSTTPATVNPATVNPATATLAKKTKWWCHGTLAVHHMVNLKPSLQKTVRKSAKAWLQTDNFEHGQEFLLTFLMTRHLTCSAFNVKLNCSPSPTSLSTLKGPATRTKVKIQLWKSWNLNVVELQCGLIWSHFMLSQRQQREMSSAYKSDLEIASVPNTWSSRAQRWAVRSEKASFTSTIKCARKGRMC
jgi:hypothetical protein